MAANNQVLAALVCLCLVTGSQAFFGGGMGMFPMMMMGGMGGNDAMPGMLCMMGNQAMCPLAMFSGSDTGRAMGMMNMMSRGGAGGAGMGKMAPLMAMSGSDTLRNFGLMSMLSGGGQQQQAQPQQQQGNSGNAGSA